MTSPSLPSIRSSRGAYPACWSLPVPDTRARKATRRCSVIRGQGSGFREQRSPYVVDGMPVEAENFRALNPADFENIQYSRTPSPRLNTVTADPAE